MRHRIAAVRAGQHLVEVDRQRVDRDLLGRHADQHAGAVRMGEVVGQLDHRLHAGRLDHLVRALGADDLAHLGGDIGVLRRPRCNGSRRARAPSRACPSSDIDRDHRMGAGERGELHDRQADAAGRRTPPPTRRPSPRVVADHAGRGGDRAAEQRRDLEIEVGGDHRHPVLGDDGVVVEGRHPAGVELLAAPAVGRRAGSGCPGSAANAAPRCRPA